MKEKGDVLKRQMAFSLQKKIDEQTEMLDLKDKKIEKLKNEVDQMKGKFEILEVQFNIKNQKIDQLKKLSGKEKKKRK